MWAVALIEFKRLMRSGKLLALVSLTLLLALVATVGAAWWWSIEVGKGAELDYMTNSLQVQEPNLGARIWWVSLVLLLPVCFIAMPVLTADMVAGEREDGTLEMLELTALRPRALVLGKFLAAVAAAFVLAVSIFPFLLLGDLAGGPSMGFSVPIIGAAVLYCLPFAAVGIGRSVRSSTRAEAMRSAFRDMLIWPAVGLAIASGGAMGVYMLRSLLNATQTSNQVVFWVCQVISFPAGFVWTDVWDWIGMTPWFWLGVPIALTIHCLRGAWGTAAWLEPTRVAERTQAQRRARADRDAGAAPLPPGVAPPKDARRRARVRRGEKSPWQRHSERIKNPVEVLAIVKKRDAAWHFALFGWILPVLIVGAPIGVDPDLATRRDFFPSFAAMAWIGLMLAYICMVTPTIITAEREGGTLNALRMTNLTAVDIVWGKLKARSTEIGLLLLFGALFVSIFYIWGSLTVTSLVLLWISGVVYVAAYSGFGAVVSLWCKRSTQAILALWALLFVPVMLSLALAMMNHFVSHRVLLPMSPLLVSYRCLVFDMPDPTGVGVYFPARIAYAIWGTSLAVHGAIAIASWWIALRKFDLVLHENRGGS